MLRWTEFAEWTKRSISGAGWAMLLRDQEQPFRYVSLGPWDSAVDIEVWRSSAGFHERLGRLEEVVEQFDAPDLSE